jgi:tetratricopeptide (TPR) repeat protein
MRRFSLRVGLLLPALGALILVALVLARMPHWRALARSYRLVKEAQTLSGKGDRLAARAKVEAAIALAPDNHLAHRERGLYLLAEGKVEEGLTELRQVAEARSRDPGAAWELAHALSATNQSVEAEPWFRRVIRMEGSNGAAYAMLANCQLQRGAEQEALESAERGVALSPRVSTTHATLGLVRWQSGDLEGARAALEEALRLRPSDVRTMLSLAAVTGQMRRYDLAAEQLSRAVLILPDDPTLWIALGTARYETRQISAAEEAFARALALEPGNKMARAALGRIGARERP